MPDLEIFDPRTIATPVYEALQNLYTEHKADKDRLREQKGQAVELYTYLSTWGMMRLKAEERALWQEGKATGKGKQQVVVKFFECLEKLSDTENLAGDQGLATLKDLDTESYLGLTGLGLTVAQEFGFWATAVYSGIDAE
jgi:hypothetical protein